MCYWIIWENIYTIAKNSKTSYNISSQSGGGLILKQLFLYFSHKLTPEQELDAKNSLGIEKFVALPDDLQKLWSNVPPELSNLNEYLTPLKDFLRQNAQKDDFVLIQGDFGASFQMVNFAQQLGLIPVYSTSKRDAIEKVVNGKVEKFSRFKHVKFREY